MKKLKELYKELKRLEKITDELVEHVNREEEFDKVYEQEFAVYNSVVDEIARVCGIERKIAKIFLDTRREFLTDILDRVS